MRGRSRGLLRVLLLLAPGTALGADAARLELDATAIRGSDELPRVMHILPWQSAEAAVLEGRPPRSLVDEVLAPLDPEVHRREVDYFEQLRRMPTAIAAGIPTEEIDRP